ncbi:hypothetical protein GCM10023080_090340 [Streptomyces pseudoechinosporeus]
MRASFRVSFTDYVPDPNDADCLHRSMTIPADQITFEDDHLVLWLAGSEIARFALNMIVAVKVEHIPRNGRREDPEELRARYPNFGQPWTAEEEARLLTLYREGEHDFDVLSAEFGRQPSAIRSRLGKLGLEQL